MKSSFKINIIVDKKNLSGLKIDSIELKSRMKFLLSLMSDFSQEVSFRFCHLQEMVEANYSYRKKNFATDVLSFPSIISENESNYLYLGDILICVPVCIQQAKKAKVTLCQELEKMMIHALVHLKGFDHERNLSAWRIMNGLEQSLQKEIIKTMKKPKWCVYKASKDTYD